MKVISFIKETKDRTVESVRNFKENPLDSLGQMIPVSIEITSFIGFLVAYIIFIINGGYVSQIDFVKVNGFDGITEAFTSGTVHIVNQGIVPIIINVLLLAQFIVMMITYFKQESKVMKVLAIIDFVFAGIFTSIILFLMVVDSRKIEISESMQNKIVNALDGMQTSSFRAVVITILITTLVCVIMFFILTLVAKSRWMIGHSAVSLLIAYVVFPLALLFLENVIPMVVGIVFIAIIVGIVWFIFTCLFGDEKSEGSSSPSNSTSRSHNKPKISEKVEAKKSEKIEAKKPKEFIIKQDAQLWVEYSFSHGGEVVIPYRKDWNGEYKVRIYYEFFKDVTLYEFKKRIIIIKINEKVMSENDLHYGKRW